MAVQNAAASIGGLSSFSPSVNAHYSSVCLGSGVSGFFIDPMKVTLIQFLKPGSVPSAYVAPKVPVVRSQSTNVLPDHYVVGSPRKPPNSQKGGVPNEG
jgi:hypothetical protein